MLAISQLLLTRFWWNFKGRFLWIFRTYSNCQGDICPCNICPRDICPYQEYLSCYWPDFDETLKEGSWEHLEQIPTATVTFVHATFVHIMNIPAVTDNWAKLYRQGQDRSKASSRQGHGNVKSSSRQGQCKFMARSRRELGKVKARSRQGREASSTTVIALMSIR